MPQLKQFTTLGGSGVPQRKQRLAGPLYDGYIEDMLNLSTNGDNMIGRVSHNNAYMSTH